jgi:hypothetical protein
MVLSKIPRYALELAILSLASSIVFYFFQFPFSLFCFLASLVVSITWVFLVNGSWLERRLEFRLRVTPSILPLAAVLLLVIASGVGLNGWVALPLDVLVACLVPGIGILYLLGEAKGGVGFSFIGMACALSIVVNGLTYSILAAVSAPTRYYQAIFLGIYLVLSVVPIARKAMTSSLNRSNGLSISLPELICTSGYLAVLAGVFYILYPTQAFVESLDITYHFADARLVSELPTRLSSNYPFFNFNQAVVLLLSRLPSGSGLFLVYNPVFQATFAVLGGVVLLLAFYSMAKSFLKGLGPQMPLVATGIFMLFGGLAWTQVENSAFGQPFSTAALGRLFTASYWDAQSGPAQSLWFWFRPITLGLLILMLLLSLLATRQESPRRTMVLVALLVTGLYFVHIPELLVFVALLLVLAVTKPISMPGLESVSRGLVLSCPIVALIAIDQTSLGVLHIGYPILGGFLLVSLLSYVFVKVVPRPNLNVSSKIIRILGLLTLVGYLAFMVIWLRSPLSFNSTSLSVLEIVPIGIYPVLLGIGGILALLAFVFYEEVKSRPLVASILILFIFFVIGRSLSLLNFYAFDTGYWERRMIEIMAVPVSILASFSLVRICSVIRSRTSSLVMVATLGLVVVLGTSSMMVGVTYGTVAVSPGLLGSSELPMADYLASNATWSHLIFASAGEESLTNYVPFHAANVSRLNFDEEYPELPLTSMVDTSYGSSYVLVSTSEIENPGTSIGSGYMVSHLLGVLPVQYESDTAVLYSVGNISAPSPTSQTCIDVAAAPSTEELFAYDMLSVLKANYTAVFDTDASLSNCSSVFLGASISQSALGQLLSSAGNASITFLGGMPNEYLSTLFIRTAGAQPTNVDEVSGPSGTLPLPSPLAIAPSQPAPGVSVTSEYVGPSNVSVPLSLRTLIGGHEVNYINIEPFIATPRAAYPCFPVIAEAAGINVNQVTSTPNAGGSFELAFASASLVGASSFKTSSVVINSTEPAIQVDLTTTQGSKTTTEVASLSIFSTTGEMTVSTSSASITGGIGFYASVSTGENLTVSGSNLEARLNFLNGTSKVLGSLRGFSISEPASAAHEFELTIRTPAVKVSGSVMLTNLEPLIIPSLSHVRGSARATFGGNVSFDLQLSDHYSVLSGLRYSGGVSYGSSSLVWSDAASIESVSPELVVAGLLLVWWFYLRRPSRGKAVERPPPESEPTVPSAPANPA